MLELYDRIGSTTSSSRAEGPIVQQLHCSVETSRLPSSSAHLNSSSCFPTCCNVERIKIVEEGRSEAREGRASHIGSFASRPPRRSRKFRRRDRTKSGRATRRLFAAPTWSAVRARAASVPQGPRHRVRRVHLCGTASGIFIFEVAYDFRKHGYTERNYTPSAPRERNWSKPVPLEGTADACARISLPEDEDEISLNPARRRRQRPQRFLPNGATSRSSAATSTPWIRPARRGFVRPRDSAGDFGENSPIGAMGDEIPRRVQPRRQAGG